MSVPGLVGKVSAASRFAFTDVALVCIKTVFVCFLSLLCLLPVGVICVSTTNTGTRMLTRMLWKEGSWAQVDSSTIKQVTKADGAHQSQDCNVLILP